MTDRESHAFAILREGARLLLESKSVAEVKAFRDRAEAVRKYAKDARLGLDLQNQAAAAKLRAERRAGEILAQMEKSHGGRPPKNRLQAATRSAGRAALSELGIEKTQSHRWQRIAAVPEAEFEQYLQRTNAAAREITAAGLLREIDKSPQATKALRRRDGAQSVGKRSQNELLSLPELVDESLHHCRQLASLLEPICSDNAASLGRAERRQVSRLLRELAEFLQTLRADSARTLR